MSENKLSCADCGSRSCYRHEGEFPGFCLTTSLSEEDISAVKKHYNDTETNMVMKVAAEIEGKYYGKLTRVEETIEFAHSIGASKIGIASCVGLMDEARIFTRIARAHGLQPYCVICKVGSFDKSEMGVPDELKLIPGQFEASCNPVMQAYILNREKTDLNVAIGLCVGHDALFAKYSKALVTTLIVKDRVLVHNPAAALYASKSYYKKMLK